MSFVALKLAVDPSDIAGTLQNIINSIFSVVTVTAFAGGGQASGTLLTGAINLVGTVVTIGDSVKFQASTPGSFCTVINNSANSCNVFPQVGDKINALAANGAYALPAGKTVDCYCGIAGTWHVLLSA